MSGVNKRKSKDLLIDVRRLREPQLKGSFSISFIVRLTGYLDGKKGLIKTDNTKVSSPWISKKQTYYNRYAAEMYKVAGEIVKLAYIQRDKINFELKKLEQELKEANAIVKDGDTQTIERKRKRAYAKKDSKEVEKNIMERMLLLKEIQISIDETEHELNQILREKKLVSEAQILNYIRGAKKVVDEKEILMENEISKSLYNAYGKRDKVYLGAEDLLKDEEKEGTENEHI